MDFSTRVARGEGPVVGKIEGSSSSSITQFEAVVLSVGRKVAKPMAWDSWLRTGQAGIAADPGCRSPRCDP